MAVEPANRFESVQQVREGLKSVNYLADEGIAGVAFLADRLGKPMLVEGPAGTGKTQLAKSIAEMTGARLIRLQCYEGLDESKALYEWNYKKQLLRIQADKNSDSWSEVNDDIFSDEFLLTRPLLEAITADDPVVLLIDEVDRVEVETEALLLEILSDYQVSIPELGTIEAKQIPLVFLTSNNTRELSEALKRRCLYLHVDYPSMEREKEIVLTKVPGVTEHLADQVTRIVRSIRHARPEEVAERVRDPRLGAHPAAAQHRDDRRADRQGDAPHPPQVPDRHREGRQGAERRLMSAAAAPQKTMLDLLNGFVAELRNAGLPVSLTENLDAMEAVQHIPIEDREAFKYALGATLIKNHSHWRAFETVFEVYFSLRGPEYKLTDVDDERDSTSSGARCRSSRRATTAVRPARWTP